MENREIYIICTRDSRGRYVRAATSNRAKAHADAERCAGEYVELYAYALTERQQIRQEPGAPTPPDVPAVVEVLHLTNAKGEFLNVEIYRVQEPGQ